MLKRKTLPVAISLLMGAAFANAATIENAGFENGMTSWTEVDPAAISGDTYNGSSALKISGSPARVHQWVDLETNTDYVVSAYVKGAGEIGVNNKEGMFEKTQFDVDSWTKVSVSFNSGAKDSTQVYAKYSSSTSQVRFDNFTIVASGTSTTPTPTPISTPGNTQAACDVTKLDVTAIDNGGNDGHTPDLAVDGSTSSDSRWSANGDGNWLLLDLGGTTSISHIDTAWFKADSRTAYFDIETSADGRNWTTAVSGAQSQGNTSLNTNELGDVYARFVRIVGFGNSSNSWNSILEAEVYGCDDITPTPSVTVPTTPPVITPAPTPSSGSSIPSLITDGSLWDLEGENPHPLVNDSTLEFVALKAQVTTPNGNGWRHEYKIKSSERVAMTDTYELFKADIKVDLSDGGKVIVAQHHAGDTGTIMKLYVADSSESDIGESIPDNGIFGVYVRIRNTSGVEEKKSLGTIRSGDSFSFEVINDYGVVTVAAFDKYLKTEVEDDSASYLKFGNYLQSQYPNGSEDCGEHGDSDSFEECYEDIGINTAKITMTNVSYERIEK